MKRTYPVCGATAALLCASWAAANAGGPVPVDSTITAVTVYPNHSARITREATLDVEAGSRTVTFDELPASIVDASVRASADGAGVQLGAVDLERRPAGEPVRERERELQAQLDQLQRERQIEIDRQDAAETQLRFIEELAQFPTQKDAAAALIAGDGERATQLVRRIGADGREVRANQRQAQQEINRFDEDIEALKRRIDQLGQDRGDVVAVSVALRGQQAGEHDLQLVYRVEGPTWKPRYEARLDTDAGELELVRSAEITQVTGEDWSGVELALSTAQPVTGEAPQPSTWWVDLRDPAEGPKPMTQAVADQAVQAQSAQEKARAPQEHHARTVSTDFATTYVIADAVSVSADGQSDQVAIGRDTVDAEISARVFPQKNPRAWLTGKAEWNSGSPLPAGPVDRFLDGAYIGHGQLPSWAPGESRALSFGIDPQLDVAFEPVEDLAGESGLITSKTTRSRGYRLELANHHDRSLPITTVLRLPVPRDERIEIEAHHGVKPDTRQWDGQQGMHAWRLELAAGEERKLDLGYDIAFPADLEIRGL